MAISTSTAKILFNVGSFDVDTSILLPSTGDKNKFYLEFVEPLAPQLTDWDSEFFFITAVMKVSFEGEEIYKNAEYDTIAAPAVNPDLMVYVDVNPQEVTTYKKIRLITDSTGYPASGKYIIDTKFVYFTNGAEYVVEEVTFEADFDWEEKTPQIDYWYDTTSPKLQVTDNQEYVVDGVSANYKSEFILYPPKNKAEVVRTYDNIQKTTYNTFWTGGNELAYTIFLTYNYGTYIVKTVKQKYIPITIYYVDNCYIYEKLKGQYDLWKSTTCGTKGNVTAQNVLFEATSIAFQILNGLGCNSSELSQLIDDFNELLDCDCGCTDSEPRLLTTSASGIETNIQTVNTFDPTTIVDLKEGNIIYMNVDVGGNTTYLEVDNIVENTNYRFILNNNSQEPTMTVEFDYNTFFDANGAMNNAPIPNGSLIIIDFFATDEDTLYLVSRNDA